MKYLHYEFQLGPNDTMEVALNAAAFVRLLDDTNYRLYRRRKRYCYYGGRAHVSPTHLRAPHAGYWHLVIDLGGNAGRLSASVTLIRR